MRNLKFENNTISMEFHQSAFIKIIKGLTCGAVKPFIGSQDILFRIKFLKTLDNKEIKRHSNCDIYRECYC